MNKLSKLVVVFVVIFSMCAPSFVLAVDAAMGEAAVTATEETAVRPSNELGKAAAAIGCGLVIIGGAMGIGRIGANTVESMARQPEIAGKIQTAMIISAALVEGVTFFALIICMMCR